MKLRCPHCNTLDPKRIKGKALCRRCGRVGPADQFEIKKAPLPALIDSTMMTCFRQCDQKFYREFVLGLRPPGLSIHLHAGACFATAIEITRRQVFKHQWSLDDALRAAHAQFMIDWGDVEAPTNPRHKAKNKDRVWEAVEDYFHVYPPLTDHVRPYYVDGDPTLEFTFAIPLDLPGFPRHPTTGEPFLYGGRFDMLGDYNRKPIPVDEKTTISISTGWADQWNLRSQFIGYSWALQQMGYPQVDTVCVRGIGILITEFKHAEAMPTYSRYLMNKWLEQLKRDLILMVSRWKEDYWDYNLGDACTSYGKCQFMEACMSSSPDSWLAHFEVKHWNPLHKNPVEPSKPRTLELAA